MAIKIDIGYAILDKPLRDCACLVHRDGYTNIPRLGYGTINAGKIAVARDLKVGPFTPESLSKAWRHAWLSLGIAK
jgi:hypothetical protein